MIKVNLTVPKYAQDMLWLTAGDDFQMQLTSQDSIKVPPAPLLLLRWGTPDGSPLAQWKSPLDALQWDGRVQIGGHVEITHLLNYHGLDLMVVEVMGQPLSPEAVWLPSLESLKAKPFERDIYFETDEELADEDSWYAFLLPVDSALADFVHHALVNGHAVDCYGVLADDNAQFHQLVGLPLVLESMTLHSSRL